MASAEPLDTAVTIQHNPNRISLVVSSVAGTRLRTLGIQIWIPALGGAWPGYNVFRRDEWGDVICTIDSVFFPAGSFDNLVMETYVDQVVEEK